MEQEKILYADDDNESVFTLLKLRVPPLVIGLFLGIGISFAVSQFEEMLARNVQVAFFLPFIVYIADAVGAQTATIYTRDLKTGKAKFHNYLVKESILGIVLGAAFGLVSWAIVSWWLKNDLLALSVGFSTACAVAVAPLIALVITQITKILKQDPAAETGPIATVIQDMISVVIFGLISSQILIK